MSKVRIAIMKGDDDRDLKSGLVLGKDVTIRGERVRQGWQSHLKQVEGRDERGRSAEITS